MTIVVTGATGAVGGLVARDLALRGADLRLVVRDESRAPDLPGAEVAVAAYDDQAALTRAIEPGDHVFMVSLHASYDERLALHRSFLEAATRRKPSRIVYLSFVGAGPHASFIQARSHGATEAMLAETGLPWTAVWNGMYADHVASWFDEEGRITGPGGDGRVSLSLRSEIAEAIAVLLAEERDVERTRVTVTTPEAFTMDELAQIASEVTGDSYRNEPLPREEWLAIRRALGREAFEIEAGVSYWDGVARGEADVVGDDYARLTGKAPLSIAEVIAEHREAMPLARRSTV